MECEPPIGPPGIPRDACHRVAAQRPPPLIQPEHGKRSLAPMPVTRRLSACAAGAAALVHDKLPAGCLPARACPAPAASQVLGAHARPGRARVVMVGHMDSACPTEACGTPGDAVCAEKATFVKSMPGPFEGKEAVKTTQACACAPRLIGLHERRAHPTTQDSSISGSEPPEPVAPAHGDNALQTPINSAISQSCTPA